MNDLHRDTPPTELEQPDPQLSLSSGRASALQITLTALGALLILGVVIYGLNRPMNEAEQNASAPPPPQTTGAAPQDQPAQPQAGGNAAGGQNAQPDASPSNEPAKQPEPEPVKPGQPDDSSR